MPPDDLQTILANFQTWGTNETAYPRDRTAFDLIAERAHARAEQPAVRFGRRR